MPACPVTGYMSRGTCGCGGRDRRCGLWRFALSCMQGTASSLPSSRFSPSVCSYAFHAPPFSIPSPLLPPPSQSNYYSTPEDRVRESSRNMFEDENNRRIADLAGQVSMLKEVGQEPRRRKGGRKGGG